MTTGAIGVEVVLFDLDDTLLDHRGAVEAGILAHARSQRYDLLDEAGAQHLWRDLEEEHYHRYLAGETDFHGQRRDRARAFAAAHGHALDDAQAGDWFAAYSARYRAAWALHADALPTLDALADAVHGIRFGIITNGELDQQAVKLDAVGLTRRMEHLVASSEVGATKPDPAIFVEACARFGVAPERAVYVGDRLRTDAIGAARAGLDGIWIDRLGTEPDPADAAEATALGVRRIGGLDALTGLVAGV
ncbi:haloacid dehalogenase [Agromyces rhizosphaerae]|uniref:Haloacid dehalogenase n=1 Tax=Agromyces rhizosphaerae TaxID=88374 RepID=A0A9W6FN55_9MICO|nr:HAD-IA family hydrolase [Agromyces rhizosphaerae]GLI26146.1 haloacid dehalogenase [Agromyces rhizosphaerae]